MTYYQLWGKTILHKQQTYTRPVNRKQSWIAPVGERSSWLVDSELRLWPVWGVVAKSMSVSTSSHSDRLNALYWRCGHMPQLVSDSSRAAHLARVTPSLLAGLLQCSATDEVSSLNDGIVLVSEKGARRLLLTLPAFTAAAGELLCLTMSVPWPGRWVSGKCIEYLGCVDKVFVDVISIDSSVSYDNTQLINDYRVLSLLE